MHMHYNTHPHMHAYAYARAPVLHVIANPALARPDRTRGMHTRVGKRHTRQNELTYNYLTAVCIGECTTKY